MILCVVSRGPQRHSLIPMLRRLLTPSVLLYIFVFILITIWRFYITSETYMGVNMVKPLRFRPP
ncbi:hypothetical protein E2C01_086300 [Portunus trituberculatus]|uniref:Uncharacterized protein n=1 Tax=Portunus trituberculatus TaxID=210409 RepID=A0A5B7JB50_PORTR|nr:hypothetical protein [Portunus trituberculatus]